jgi:hypothetical protein
MECKDKIFVWNGIVAEGIQASDISTYSNDGAKELPVVLIKVSSLIWQFHLLPDTSESFSGEYREQLLP